MIFRQTAAVFKKNLKRHLYDKKKLLSQFIFPVVISGTYYLSKKYSDDLGPVAIIFSFLLTIYIGLINGSLIKETITLFVNEREEGSRQYQYVMGMSKKVHTLANMLYIMVYTSVFLFPFYVTLNCYGFKLVYIFNFAAFVISSNFLAIALTSFFGEHKVATEVIGLLFSIGAFLPFLYQAEVYNFKHYLAIFVPNSSFALSILAKNDTDSFTISLASLMMWKFYLLIFYVVEFREDSFQCLKNFFIQCKTKLGIRSGEASQMLMHDIETASVLFCSEAEDDAIGVSPPTLELINVSKEFGEVKAVNGVSLKFYKSEILGLLGRNGAGKTTLVDMITNVTIPTSGEIKFNHKKDHQITIGICYQHEILYEDLSVKDHLKFYSEIKGVENPEEEISRIVNKVGIEGELDKKAKELSGGNKRKLSFSIALLNSPELLIFDEPTSGLDPLSRRNIWETLENLRSAEATIILTTHHLDEADHLSDKICVIKKGEIVEQGTPEEIKKKYGRGDYMTINYNHESNTPFEISACDKIIKETLPSGRLTDKTEDSLKYFIDKSEDYSSLIKCVKILEQIHGITISLEPNSLEQSFIAIDADEANASEILAKSVCCEEEFSTSIGHISQIKGVLIKNFYCFIGKFHWFYNMNLIILLMVIAINDLLIEKILSSNETNGADMDVVKEQSNSNPMFIIQGYVIMSSAFLSIPVMEKEEKIIQLLRTRGLTKLNYWIGHFIFDFVYFCINFGVMLLFFTESLKSIPILVILATACAIIFYSYNASMIFNKVKTANSWFTVINTLVFLIMMPLLVPESLIEGTFFVHLKPLKYFSPYFDISYALIKQQKIMTELDSLVSEPQNQEYSYSVHICLLIYFTIFVLLQSSIIQKLISRVPAQTSTKQIELENVSKNYDKIEALRNVSYSINNERIALLGHNGAGKSTTFQLISSQIHQSSGNIFLEKKFKSKYDDVMTSAGICYQEDTLWKFMTPSKVLQIFSFIVPNCKSNETNFMFETLDIESQLKTRKFENLSGGNKRKICMSVCLMGSPKIKLLDECSTGLDPISRLSMVNTIKMQNDGCTIFTTHSIPEAEKICGRAIIMKKGEVSEDNKIFKLKEKYYDCYWIELPETEEEYFEDKVKQIFKEYNPEKLKRNTKKRRVEIPKSDIKLSDLMILLYEYVDDNFIIDEPKLEDVYLLLTADETQEVEMLNV